MARQQPQPQTPQLQESPQPRLNVHSMQTAERKKHALREGISQENAPYKTVVMQLQRQVANAYLLYTNYKHYHWQTYGPLFRDLHLLFDEFADGCAADHRPICGADSHDWARSAVESTGNGGDRECTGGGT